MTLIDPPVRFIHFHNDSRRGGSLWGTVAYVPSEFAKVDVATASVHTRDSGSRAVGRAVAAGRLRHGRDCRQMSVAHFWKVVTTMRNLRTHADPDEIFGRYFDALADTEPT